MRRRTCWAGVLLAAVLLPPALAAAQAVPAARTGEGLVLAPQVEVLRDESGQLTFADMKPATIEQAFALSGPQGLNFGFTRAAYWYRFIIENRASGQPYSGVLEAAFPPLDFLDLYVTREDGRSEHLASGDQRPPGASGIAHRNHAFPIRLAPGEQVEVYLRAQIDGAHQVPLTLWSRDAFFHKTARENLYHGMFYGIMLVMVIYNLLIFIGVRDRAYLYYLLFVAMLAGLLVNLDGFAFPILWSISPRLVNGSVPLSIALATVFVPLFVRISLQTRQFTPRLHQVLTGALVLAAGSVLLPFVLPVMEATFINALIGALTTIVMACVILVQALMGRRTAHFYLVVWGVLMAGIIIKVMEVNGLLPVNALTTYSIHIGACFLVTLVSLGLADQINQDRHERARLAREKVEAQATTKSEFLAKMSHELRTPMNAIIGFTDLALRSDSHARRLEHLGHIDTASRSLLHILNDVLDLSKIESGKLALEASEFELQPILDKATGLVGRPADAKGLELIVSKALEVPRVLIGDPLRLEQVLINLMSNAVKFSDSGEVSLSATLEKRDDPTAHVQFSVRDSGIGITPEQLTKLFTPFTQADPSMTRKYGGSGLGLAVCKQLVELMGGKIQVKSEPGWGSEFRFTLPLGIGTTQQGADQLLGGKRVLVVDHHAGARWMYGNHLSQLQVDSESTESAAGALALLERSRFDAVLLNWKLSGPDGIETLRRIRADERFVRIPVILLTGHGREDVVRDAISAGASACLAKPVKVSVLLSTLLELLQPGALAKSDAREQVGQTLAARQLRGAQVLLVEDNALNRRLAGEILTEAGVAVDMCEDGQQALAAVQKKAYDAVLMDVQMPVMDGFTATRAIRELPGFERLPIIAMTANALPQDREQALACGMSDFLPKPIDAQQVLGMLARWVPPQNDNSEIEVKK